MEQIFLKIYLGSIPLVLGAIIWLIKDKFKSSEQRVIDLRTDMELHIEKALSDLPTLRDRVSRVAEEVILKYSELEIELRKTLGELEIENTKFELLSPLEQRKKTESLSKRVNELTDKVHDSHEYLNIKVDEVNETISMIEEKILSCDNNVDEFLKKELSKVNRLIEQYHNKYNKNLELIESNLKNIMSVMVYMSKNNETLKKSQKTMKDDISRINCDITRHEENFARIKNRAKLR